MGLQTVFFGDPRRQMAVTVNIKAIRYVQSG